MEAKILSAADFYCWLSQRQRYELRRGVMARHPNGEYFNVADLQVSFYRDFLREREVDDDQRR